MKTPSIFSPDNRLAWLGIGVFAIGQTFATMAGVAGTRIAFSSLDEGPVSVLSLILIAGSALALVLCRAAVRISAEGLGQAYTADIRQALFSAAMHTPPEEIAKRRRGYLMLRLTGDMATMKDGLSRSIPQAVQAISLSIAGLTALALMDVRFFAVAFAVTVTVAAAAHFSTSKVYAAHSSLRQQRAKVATDMAERLPIAPELLRLGRRTKELSRLRRQSKSLRHQSMMRLRLIEGLRALPELLSGMAAATVLFDGSNRGLSAGDIAACLAALGLLAFGLSQISAVCDRLSGWKVAATKLHRYLNGRLEGPTHNVSGKLRISHKASRISIEAPDIMVPGSISANIGGAARAKCTNPEEVISALTKTGSFSSMRIEIDGIGLDELTPGSIRRNIGIVSPHPSVLKGSVRRNLTLGLRHRPDDPTLLRRIARAGLQESLSKLGGLDGKLSEGGRTLTDTDRVRLAALQTAVCQQKILLADLRSSSPPADVDRCLASGNVAVIWLDAPVP